MTSYSTSQIRSARTLLFVPGCRPERFAKAAAAAPDIVLIDLEDAVAPADKSLARNNAQAWLSGGVLQPSGSTPSAPRGTRTIW